jgi:hypothetical protein
MLHSSFSKKSVTHFQSTLKNRVASPKKHNQSTNLALPLICFGYEVASSSGNVWAFNKLLLLVMQWYMPNDVQDHHLN